MNNNEIEKIIELKKKRKNLGNVIKELNEFLRFYNNSFREEESKKALDRIESYVKNTVVRRNNIGDQIQSIANEIVCNHEMLIDVILEYECPVCKKIINYKDIPPTTKYLVSYYVDKKHKEIIDNKINEIVLSSIDEETANEELLEYFSNKQIEEGFSLRRYIK
ncbi:MAG: hypothetical protein IKR57_02460 [Bacilli bacterium]|nr:hypothetical protein [Bacilli bacterium]